MFQSKLFKNQHNINLIKNKKKLLNFLIADFQGMF